eukprot:3818156-Pleurochrysis_carterae.AAC.2
MAGVTDESAERWRALSGPSQGVSSGVPGWAGQRATSAPRHPPNLPTRCATRAQDITDSGLVFAEAHFAITDPLPAPHGCNCPSEVCLRNLRSARPLFTAIARRRRSPQPPTPAVTSRYRRTTRRRSTTATCLPPRIPISR